MNKLDIIYAIPMAYFIWKGLKRGVVFEMASLAGILLGCWVAVHFSQWVARMLGLEGDGATLIAFFVTFVGVALLSLLVGKAAQNLLKMAKISFLDRFLGAALGLAKAVCILGVLTSYVVLIDHQEKVLKPQTKEASMFYKPMVKTGGKLVASLQTFIAQRRYEREMKAQHND
ncbi:MAG: CvpA family protein [Bacteroidales bacterium]|nr:CvpA family protein [Bacteroidales bacterium]